MNEGKIDITTDLGKDVFRTALLKLADNSIKVLKDANAQGMITWDPEGQQFLGACYYGDPRLTPVLAPETELKGDRGMNAIDEYFEKFRQAGLRVGVCLRPQQITMVDGKPVQGPADSQHAAQVLKDKLAYAKKRWGCTLFYIDSTVVVTGESLNPEVFKTVADAYPDVLLSPKNQKALRRSGNRRSEVGSQKSVIRSQQPETSDKSELKGRNYANRVSQGLGCLQTRTRICDGDFRNHKEVSSGRKIRVDESDPALVEISVLKP